MDHRANHCHYMDVSLLLPDYLNRLDFSLSACAKQARVGTLQEIKSDFTSSMIDMMHDCIRLFCKSSLTFLALFCRR